MKKESETGVISTIFGLGSNIDGTIEFKNTMRVDGNIKGKINGQSGTVIIGEKAVVDAEITVDAAIIMGQVSGVIDARESIEIYPPGRVSCDIQAPKVIIKSGVVFNGNCIMNT